MAKTKKKKDTAKRPTRNVELMPLIIIGMLTVFAFGMWAWRGESVAMPKLHIVAPGGHATAGTPAEPPPVPFQVPKLPAGAVGKAWRADGDKALMVRPDGSRLTLTLEPKRQAAIGKLLKRRRVAYSAVVIIDAKTGRVQIWADHTEKNDPAARGHSLATSKGPAASVIKIVTTSALLEAGVERTTKTCFHGGLRGIKKWHLKPRPEFDKRCESLTQALARSSNVVFARRTLQHLGVGALANTAERFYFGHDLRFDVRGRKSRFSEGTSKLRRARAAAGFVGATLSPLHGAVIGAAIANDGMAMQPHLIVSDSAQPGHVREPAELGRMVSAEHAKSLMSMLATTTVDGTARKAFRTWPRELVHIGVAGKTGSLNGRSGPYRHYSWFVGAAPATKPEIGFAVLAVNGKKGRSKAAALARDALAIWFGDRRMKEADDPLAE